MEHALIHRSHTLSADRALLLLCLATFIGFLTVGLPLAVIPLYVHDELGYGAVVVGSAVGVQFLATVLTRGYAGRLADQQGARPAMRRGLVGCGLAGAFYLLSSLLPVPAAGKLALLIAGRLTLGVGESFLVTGMLAWGIGTVGVLKSGKVMSWTGMAIYGAMALGAPAGLALYEGNGLAVLGLVTLGLPLLGLALIRPVAAVAPSGGQRRSFISVIGRIWQPALALALQGVGFAAIGAFISLHFATEGWQGAGLALSCFGLAFAAMRVVAGHLPDKLGGPPVAMVSLLVEGCGLLLLWSATSAELALAGAALTGAGASLIFPSLGLVVVKRVEPQVRATALGGYAAFQDIAYGLTGPLTGLLVGVHGYPVAFLVAALAAFAGFGIAAQLYRQDRRQAAP
ncbi:arabinose transporter [Stutzerimonas nosocomialis]|nr:arabinose transporter [Stutzerimonas nosocomialis]TLX54090.1 arabinose transporter [Stutzerimonas nosocomialis]